MANFEHLSNNRDPENWKEGVLKQEEGELFSSAAGLGKKARRIAGALILVTSILTGCGKNEDDVGTKKKGWLGSIFSSEEFQPNDIEVKAEGTGGTSKVEGAKKIIVETQIPPAPAVSAQAVGDNSVVEEKRRITEDDLMFPQNFSQTERVQIQNRGNLTESSLWSNDIVSLLLEEKKKVKTGADAEGVLLVYFNKFCSEYYFPTVGYLEENQYGIKMRNYTEDDLKLLLNNMRILERVVEEFHDSYDIATYDVRKRQVLDMINKVERKLSPAGQMYDKISGEYFRKPQ